MGFIHKGKKEFKSFSGGIFSLMTLLVILAYFIYLASDVWNFEVALKSSLLKRDLVFDNSTYGFNSSNFDFAVNLEYIGFNKTRKSKLHQFVSLEVVSVRTYWEESEQGAVYAYDVKWIGAQKCPAGIFNNDSAFLDQLDIVGNYFCPTSSNFTLQGSSSSKESSFLLSISGSAARPSWIFSNLGGLCFTGGAEGGCLRDELLLRVYGIIFFWRELGAAPPIELPTTQQGGPLRAIILHDHQVGSEHSDLKDSQFFSQLNARNESYTTVRIYSQYSRTYLPYNPNTPFIAMMIFMDEDMHINERTAFNLVTALQSIGGFASVIMIFARITFVFFQKANYYQEIISLLYSCPQADDTPFEKSINKSEFPSRPADFLSNQNFSIQMQLNSQAP
eukprot:CAMPEP_0170544808 /NCGR_PEP_ID=MMETSP0211-20121228/3428_1 /TAXON_ID=311385 /ORGANISM="Pseudokeronopsis sp., Strain OXSARD2" /LENGTH=390 /DNA_ID=CAMNT_0010848549 /DNA_START=100 /DNA_END=1275 /DNA_ORIENTATION=+